MRRVTSVFLLTLWSSRSRTDSSAAAVGIPEMMQAAGAQTSRGNVLVITASFIVVSTVQRLMEIPDEVRDELERNNLLFKVGRRIGSSAANS